MFIFNLLPWTDPYVSQMSVSSAGKCHGVWFSNTPLQSSDCSFAPSDSSDHQQVTFGSRAGHQWGLNQPEDALNTQHGRSEMNLLTPLCNRQRSTEEKCLYVALRRASIYAENISKDHRKSKRDFWVFSVTLLRALQIMPMTVCHYMLNVCWNYIRERHILCQH